MFLLLLLLLLRARETLTQHGGIQKVYEKVRDTERQREKECVWRKGKAKNKD